MQEFNEFYEQTYVKFYRFIILNIPNISNTDDILQEAYLKMFKILKKKKIVDKEAYLYKVGWNLIKKEFKLKDSLPLNEDLGLCTNNTYDGVLQKMDLETIYNYLKTKDILVQKAFYLYYYGLSLEAIATTLNISLSKVKNNIYRTLKELKGVLQ